MVRSQPPAAADLPSRLIGRTVLSMSFLGLRFGRVLASAAVLLAVIAIVATPVGADASGAPQRATGGWHQVDTPAAGPRGSDLYGVSCLDAKTCWALGDKFIAHHEVAEMTWKFSHGEWRERGLPDVWKRPHKGEVGVDDLSCTAKRCFAVGVGRRGRAAAWSWSPGRFLAADVGPRVGRGRPADERLVCRKELLCRAGAPRRPARPAPAPSQSSSAGTGGGAKLARPAKATAHTHWMDVGCARPRTPATPSAPCSTPMTASALST